MSFSSQHQPRFLGDHNHIVLFDNGPERVSSTGCTADCARGLHLTLDHDAMTMEVAREYFPPLSLKTLVQGGFMTLENGNALVAWGSQPGITEHKEDEVVMDIQFGRIVDLQPGQFGGGGAVYRPFKGDWKGTPPWDPSIAVVGETVYFSWNGATEVAGWLVVSPFFLLSPFSSFFVSRLFG
ncbi:hypothetical protein IMZ48_43640 [Candidatus Bathyarchaeota archaeon]|nr:hypothetical protein [Candidatus Bathyarchaeota archaeon]